MYVLEISSFISFIFDITCCGSFVISTFAVFYPKYHCCNCATLGNYIWLNLGYHRLSTFMELIKGGSG
ncbi:hypothetical protein GIB67_020882, partial [Kingdonia uniflora]